MKISEQVLPRRCTIQWKRPELAKALTITR
jgi:hypothetical protein